MDATSIENEINEIKKSLSHLKEKIARLKLQYRNLPDPDLVLGRMNSCLYLLLEQLDNIDLGLYCYEIGEQLMKLSSNNNCRRSTFSESLHQVILLIQNHISNLKSDFRYRYLFMYEKFENNFPKKY